MSSDHGTRARRPLDAWSIIPPNPGRGPRSVEAFSFLFLFIISTFPLPTAVTRLGLPPCPLRRSFGIQITILMTILFDTHYALHII